MLKPSVRRLFLITVFLSAIVTFGGIAQPSSGAPNDRFLIASDIHFDPFADPALVADLAAAPVAKWEMILNGSTLTRYSQYSQDTNWWLLQSTLDAMHEKLHDPALVMITGDLLAHNFPETFRRVTHDNDREHYRIFVLKTIQFLALESHERLNGSKVLITPGNNDNECGNYDIEADGPFLADTAGVAQHLAHGGGSFVKDWNAFGSYTVRYPTVPGIRIISLNTVFFSKKYHAASFNNGCSEIESAAALRTFTWLKNNLARAAQAHEKVWLMFHIPPGIDGYSTMVRYQNLSKQAGATSETCINAIVPLWDPIWTARFEGLLKKYRSTIAASFSGHTHSDDFRLASSARGRTFVLIDPPVSPVYGQNPAFRVVTFRRDGGVADLSTYFLTNLKTASSHAPGKWMLEYKFSRQWRVRRVDGTSLKILLDEIEHDPHARSDWFKLYGVSSAAARVPTSGERSLYCASGYLNEGAYQTCYCPAKQVDSSAAPTQ